MSDNILKMAKSFKDIAELQAYCDSQYKTIVDLSKKINRLEEEKRHLEADLSKSGTKPSSVGLIIEPSLSNEELICLTQLQLLREISDRAALTLEESRKFDIFTKALKEIRTSSKDSGEKFKNLDDEALLALIEKK